MADKKAEFYWAIIGDANPEPVAVSVGEDGKRLAYTIGCPDPFELDVPEPNIELVESSAMFSGAGWKQRPIKLEPPSKLRAADHEKRRLNAEDRLEKDRKRGVVHGWQRWNP